MLEAAQRWARFTSQCIPIKGSSGRADNQSAPQGLQRATSALDGPAVVMAWPAPECAALMLSVGAAAGLPRQLHERKAVVFIANSAQSESLWASIVHSQRQSAVKACSARTAPACLPACQQPVQPTQAHRWFLGPLPACPPAGAERQARL